MNTQPVKSANLSFLAFAKQIPKLPIAELIATEYRIGNQWRSVVSIAQPNNLTTCHICDVVQNGEKNLRCHLQGKKHRAQEEKVQQFYHAKYTYSKNQRNLGSRPVSKMPATPTNANVKTVAQSAKGLPVNKTQQVPKPIGYGNAAELKTQQQSSNSNNPNAKVPIQAKQTQNPKVPIQAKQIQNAKVPIQAKQTQNPKVPIQAKQIQNAKVPIQAKQTQNAKVPIQVKSIQNVASQKLNQQSPRRTDSVEASPNIESTIATPSVQKSKIAQKTQSPVTKSGAVAKPAVVPSNSNPPLITNKIVPPRNQSEISQADKTKCSATKPIQSTITEPSQVHLANPGRTTSAKSAQPTVAKTIVKKTALAPTAKASTQASQTTPKSTKSNVTQATITKSGGIVNAVNSVNPNIAKSVQPPLTMSSESTSAEPLQANIVSEANTVVGSHNLNIPVHGIDQQQNVTISKIVDSISKNDALLDKTCVSHTNFSDESNVNAIRSKDDSITIEQDSMFVAHGSGSVLTESSQIVEKDNATPQKESSVTIELTDDIDTMGTMVVNPYALKINSRLTISKQRSTEKLPATNEPSTGEVIIINDSSPPNKNKRSKERDAENFVESTVSKKLRVLTPATINAQSSHVHTDDIKSDKLEDKAVAYQTNIEIVPTKYKKPVHPKPKYQPIAKPFGFTIKTFGDNDVHGLIGIEYVIKISKYDNDPSPRFECGLCELKLNGADMQNHLLGYSHRLKYCEKHFSTAMQIFKKYMYKVPEHEIYKVMAPVLDKLAKTIEEYHGRNLPYDCFLTDYNMKRHDILDKVYSIRHASEQNGPTFTHVVDSKEVDKLIEKTHAVQPKLQNFPEKLLFNQAESSKVNAMPYVQMHPTLNQHGKPIHHNPYNFYPQTITTQSGHFNYHNQIEPVLDTETHKLMVEQFLRKTGRSEKKATSPRHRQKRKLAERENYQQKRSRMFSVSPTKSISPLRENDIWQAYRHMVDLRLTELKNVFKSYRKDPENHPSYNEEWQKFWKRRRNELIATGLDHRSYNFQPEWVRFFNVRLEELYSESVENIKIQSRNRLCLPMTNDEIEDPLYHVQAQQPVQNSNSYKVANSSDHHKNKEPELFSFDSVDRLELQTPQMKETLDQQDATAEPKVVDVLRLLSGLEDYLGSLGPRIVDLLVKAVQIEKRNPSNLPTLILTVENCSLLETAVEKFKGIVITGLSSGSQERALKRAITDVNVLLKYAEKQSPSNIISQAENVVTHDKRTGRASTQTSVLREPSHNKTSKLAHENQTTNNTTVSANHAPDTNIVMPTDQEMRDLTVKVAAGLAKQGRHDCDFDQLKQLITAYTVLERRLEAKEKYEKSQSNQERVEALVSNVERNSLSSSLAVLQSEQSSMGQQSIGQTSVPKNVNNPTLFGSSQTNYIGSQLVANPNTFNMAVPHNTNNFQGQGYSIMQNSTNPTTPGNYQTLYNNTFGVGMNQIQNSQYTMNTNRIDNNFNSNTAMTWNGSTNSYLPINNSNQQPFWR